MNYHLKLRELGFRKTTFYKPNERIDGPAMILDDTEITYILGPDMIRKKVVTEKIHRKSDSFYVLEYDATYTIWVKIMLNNIYTIWLEDRSIKVKKLPWNSLREDLSILYDRSVSYVHTPKIANTRQIINLLPLTIKRDLILNKLFKR